MEIDLQNIISLDKQRESFFKKMIFGLFYIGLYQYIHLNYLAVTWAYMRYFHNNIDYFQIILTYLLALFPIFFYTGLNKISSYFSIIIYIMAYVPIIVTLSYNNTEEMGYLKVFSYQLVLAMSMSSFFYIDKLKNISRNKPHLTVPIIWFHAFTVLVTGYLIYKFSGNMRLVSFADVYDLRSQNSEASNTISGYFTMWATYFIYPVYFTSGLIYKNKKFLIIGIIGHLIIYMITGAKASVLMPLIILGFYMALTRIKFLSFSQTLILFISLLSVFFLLNNSDVIFPIKSVFLMRTLSMPGYLFSDYLSFFSENPHTHYAHISFINALTGAYPYGNTPLGTVIGQFDNSGANANANFWATDGIAAYGIVGIMIITLIMNLFFLYINNLFKDKKTIFIFLVFTGSTLSLLNVSFFTTLLSGGLILLVISLRVFNFEKIRDTRQKKKFIFK